jgi:hypothetical protein
MKRVWEELGVGRGELDPEGEWLEAATGPDASSVDIGGKDGEKSEGAIPTLCQKFRSRHPLGGRDGMITGATDNKDTRRVGFAQRQCQVRLRATSLLQPPCLCYGGGG